MQLRERYACDGPDSFDTAELLALVIGLGHGGSSAQALAHDLLERCGGLEALLRSEVTELAAVRGVGPARAVRVHAALALGHRAARRSSASLGEAISEPARAASLLVPALGALHHEELHALYLDRRHRVIARRRLTSGSQAFTVVDPAQVLRVAVGIGASALVLAHNHPSGDPSPSAQDREVTRRVAAAARTLGIGLVDHLIIAGSSWVSLAELGEIDGWTSSLATWVSDGIHSLQK